MKTIRVLLVASAFALFAGIAAANCGTCDKKDQCSTADKAKCAEHCDKDKTCCGKDCQCPECKKHCAADKAKGECSKDCQCPKCKDAAGKGCEKPKDEAKK